MTSLPRLHSDLDKLTSVWFSLLADPELLPHVKIDRGAIRFLLAVRPERHTSPSFLSLTVPSFTLS